MSHGSTISARNGTPRVCTVIASTGAREELRVCLESLATQCADASVEVLVVRGATPAETESLRTASPNVRFVNGPRGATARELRAIGMNAADADIVAFTDDAPIRRDGWIEGLLARAPFRAGR